MCGSLFILFWSRCLYSRASLDSPSIVALRMSVFAAFWRVSQSALSFLDLNESSSTQALYVNFGTQLTSQSELQVVLEMWLPAVYVQLSPLSSLPPVEQWMP